jgi:RNA polymerase sigma-70 factor (ECF subfamily)
MDSRIKQLCRRVKKVDKNAASELLQIFYMDIYTYLMRLCGNQQNAEDLTQQTFLKVWASFDSFAGRSRFSTWLYKVAYNTYVDWQRSNINKTISYPNQWWLECLDHKPGPFANTAERQLALHLYKAVEKLDEDKKHVVHMHYYQGLSIRETAKVLGIATSTVKYRLRKVMKILRKKINIEENENLQRKTIPIAKGKVI